MAAVSVFAWLEVEPDYDRVIGSCCFPGNTKSRRVTVRRVKFPFWFPELIN